MNNFLKIFEILFLSIFTLSLISCDQSDELTLDNREGTKIRLKYLTTTAEVAEALGDYVAGWDLRELDLTDIGAYPNFPYVYYYELGMSKNIPGSYLEEYRNVWAGAGVGTGDETLEQILEESQGRKEAINDERLREYPRVFAVKDRDNTSSNRCTVELFLPHIDLIGNKTMQSVRLTGQNTPLPTDRDVVTTMLSLLEVHE